MHKIRTIILVLYFSSLISQKVPAQTAIAKDQLITNIQLIDGTGRPPRSASVRIHGERIAAIGNLLPVDKDSVIDGKGLILAPGFIDSHSHHLAYLRKNPDGLAACNQGITTIVIGQDGSSYPMDSLSVIFKAGKFAVNIASYTGQTTLREMVMGKDLYRSCTRPELEKMKELLRKEMEKGSLGLSTGLEYEGAFYSSTNEVVELAKVAANYNGRYISHIRSEDLKIEEAIREVIEIGKVTKMPVQISHIKIANRDDWESADKFIRLLEKARSEGINITADVYPYTYWNSTLRVLFPDKQFSNLQSAELAVAKLFDPNGSILVHFAPEPAYQGRTVTDIAKTRNETPAQTLIQLVSMAEDHGKKNPDSDGVEAIAGRSMHDNDVREFIRWPHSNICSDGNAGGHPRGFGAFTRVLGKYVREDNALTMENAIHKMSGLTARHLGLKDRGTISVGNYADLVLIDPEIVNDKATLQDSHAISEGIERVWVNGKVIYQHKKSMGSYSGMLVKRPE